MDKNKIKESLGDVVPKEDVKQNMQPKQLTAEEWHKIGARALRIENEKIISKFIDQIQDSFDQIQDSFRENEKRQEANRKEGLRDALAMAALTGFCTNRSNYYNSNFKNSQLIAEGCYKFADAMLKARKA